MSKSVLARFSVLSRTERPYDPLTPGSETSFEISMQAVTGPTLDPEIQSFFRATPDGQINMAILTPEAADLFKPGRDVYVRFSPVES